MSQKGKCTNLANCVLAYRGEEVEAPENAFVCPECGKPLEATAPVAKAARSLLVPGLIVALAVLLLGIVVFFGVSRLQQRLVTAAPEATPTPESTPAVEASEAPAPATGEVSPAASETSSVVPSEINLDPQSEQNAQVKAEVLKRIDLMPTISSENKDKLYFSVERARQMGKIVKIPFGFGQRTLTAEDIEALRGAAQTDRVQEILEDPTAVLVLLGYADAKGDEDKNLKISQDRAEAVGKNLRDDLKVLNVMHAVGMGSSTLFDESGNEKNRVVEVWVVLP